MTRVVGGLARGRRLVVPSDGTRPTSDRAREAVFSSIESMRGPWHGASVLDLYAGTGACGLEAASRGASRVDLVDKDRNAVRALTTNRDAVLASDVESVVTVHQSQVERWVADATAGTGYDVAFCDPPYAMTTAKVQEVLGVVAERGLLKPEALVVLERSSRDDPWEWQHPYRGRWDRAYGEAHLWVAELSG
ncbi:MAG TPA: RsmD family RNA methyltransferase [Actinomycetes bacterium]|nr:RsmD family RNA methyltransferase [Actinomycetes bacterium]